VKDEVLPRLIIEREPLRFRRARIVLALDLFKALEPRFLGDTYAQPGVLASRLERAVGRLKFPADFIGRYDRPQTLFYLDPPYWGCERDYGQDVFCRDDFAALAEQLAGIKGKFLLSINDMPGAREVFGRFAMRELETTYQVGGMANAKKVGELLISNC